MRIFLAGASGVIGRLLIPLLVDRGHSVVGATRSAHNAELIKSLGATPVIADVFDKRALLAAVGAATPDLIMHQLTDLPDGLEASKMEAHLPLNARIRTEGTQNLIAAALAAKCPRVIAQSIAWVYAPGPEPHQEGDPLNVSADGLLGVTVRGVAALEHSVLNTPPIVGLVLRYGAFYGTGTGAAGPATTLPSVNVTRAAEVTTLAVERSVSGIFNIAEPNPWISIKRAQSELSWGPS